MGYIKKLSCQCGYNKSLKLGTGRHIPDAAYIRDNFSPEKLEPFNKAESTGMLGALFYIENIMSYCPQCKEIREGRALHFQVGQTDKIIYDLCPTCCRTLESISVSPQCPLCGKPLTEETSGLWD